MTEQPLVSIRGLVKQYPGVLAVDGASFDIPPRADRRPGRQERRRQEHRDQDPGRSRAAGRGGDLVDGQPVSVHDPRQAEALGFAFMHQELEQFPLMSVAENVMLGSKLPRHAGVLVNWRTHVRTGAGHARRSRSDDRPAAADRPPVDRPEARRHDRSGAARAGAAARPRRADHLADRRGDQASPRRLPEGQGARRHRALRLAPARRDPVADRHA